MYLDAAYLAKYYLNEPDSPRVRKVILGAATLTSSAWSIAEVSCVFHRYLREGQLSARQVQMLSHQFLADVDSGLWNLVAVTTGTIRAVAFLTARLPAEVFLRAGDAVHLVTALQAAETEVWTNDRHMLAAAPHLGLTGRTA
jgi:predicted nucleic acid-binding protein